MVSMSPVNYAGLAFYFVVLGVSMVASYYMQRSARRRAASWLLIAITWFYILRFTITYPQTSWYQEGGDGHPELLAMSTGHTRFGFHSHAVIWKREELLYSNHGEFPLCRNITPDHRNFATNTLLVGLLTCISFGSNQHFCDLKLSISELSALIYWLRRQFLVVQLGLPLISIHPTFIPGRTPFVAVTSPGFPKFRGLNLFDVAYADVIWGGADGNWGYTQQLLCWAIVATVWTLEAPICALAPRFGGM